MQAYALVQLVLPALKIAVPMDELDETTHASAERCYSQHIACSLDLPQPLASNLCIKMSPQGGNGISKRKRNDSKLISCYLSCPSLHTGLAQAPHRTQNPCDHTLGRDHHTRSLKLQQP